MMNKSDIARLRRFNQQIAATKFTRPEEIVRWLGAMQAQDYPMAKWAIGLRLPGTTAKAVEKALEDGLVLRTHLMRPTWHFVAAADLRWLLALSAPQLRSTSAAAMRQLGLDPETCARSRRVIGEALAGGRHLTRAELMLELAGAGIESDNYRAGYLMYNAEIEGVVCSGARRGKLQTYALLDERTPKSADLSREEAIGELVRRYFTSHAPATLKDFVWWSGLPVADARRGLEMNKSSLICEEIDGQVYWLPDSLSIPPAGSGSLDLLPAFDEFTVSYKDRTASLDPERAREAITGNGIFKPIVVIDGKIAGIWERSYQKNSVVVEKNLFFDLDESQNEAFRLKAAQYAAFEGKDGLIFA
jgi:hypothetical protein